MNFRLIKIIYEDKDFLVINKPAGLVVHGDGRTDEPTLVDWLIKKYPKIKKVGEPIEEKVVGKTKNKIIYRPGIVHRLDKDTSGVMVIAKNQDTFLFLKTQFQDREVKKFYRAFVYGEIQGDRGLIDRPIGRSGTDFRRFSSQRGAKGEMREAKTIYRVLKRDKGYSYLEVMPKTGRTHQIRVHLKAINYPVVCDKLYAPKLPCALGFKRLALHAKTLIITTPSGEKQNFEAPLPKDFETAEKLLKFNI